MNNDIEVLAGRFGNRRGTTDEERAAANYLLGRFKSYSPFAYLDSFFTTESYFLVFSMYYTEFLIVSIIAIWATQFSTFYGILVFVAYLIECNGIRLLSRLIPPAESQNIVAPFHVEKPKRLIVVTAGYDTQVDGILSNILRSGYAHWLHRVILLLMMAVIVSTAANDMVLAGNSEIPWPSILRWSAAACLSGTALLLYAHDKFGEDVRGANNNASGVGTLLTLAEELNRSPLEHSDVWLVALGNSYGSSEGIRHILKLAPQSKSEIYVINVQGVGCGHLHYLRKEGFMQAQAYDKKLQGLAENEDRLPHAVYRGIPTPGHWASQHGYASLTLMGLENEIETPHAWSDSDRLSEIDPDSVTQATDIIRNLLLRLDSDS